MIFCIFTTATILITWVGVDVNVKTLTMESKTTTIRSRRSRTHLTCARTLILRSSSPIFTSVENSSSMTIFFLRSSQTQTLFPGYLERKCIFWSKKYLQLWVWSLDHLRQNPKINIAHTLGSDHLQPWPNSCSGRAFQDIEVLHLQYRSSPVVVQLHFLTVFFWSAVTLTFFVVVDNIVDLLFCFCHLIKPPEPPFPSMDLNYKCGTHSQCQHRSSPGFTDVT